MGPAHLQRTAQPSTSPHRSARWLAGALVGATLVLTLASCSSDEGAPMSDAANGDVGVLFEAGSLDTTAADTTGRRGVDAGPQCPGGDGCPCLANDDCDGAACLEGADGRRCAARCVETCPDGFTCTQVPVGADFTFACVSLWARLCQPCDTTQDCQYAGVSSGRCVPRGEAGSFCGASCEIDAHCPANYGCKSVKDVAGATVKQCLPLGADGAPAACHCSANGVALAAHTGCSKSLVVDEVELTCAGVATCLKAGVAPTCVADEPAKEVCDGADNDCDGDTDESSCDDGEGCTTDACDPATGCAHQAVGDGQACDADGSVCTQGDTCTSGVCVAGPALSCDDKNPCTQDVCQPASGCTQTDFDGVPCDDDNPCTVGDVCKGGGCGAGKPKVCTATEPCVAAKCDLTQGGKCAYTNQPAGAACDDGSACSTGDTCTLGVCAGASVSCDDNNPCTTDTCAPKTGCAHSAGSGSCDDGDACTVADSCVNQGCQAGKAKVCDDGNACTADSCAPKTGCVHSGSGAGTACSDGSVCTQGDTCAKGACKPGKLQVCDDNNPCTTDSCDAKAGCVAVANSADCDDGDPCTVGSKCAGKVCGPGQAKDCDDNNPCTTDSCTKGACSTQPVTNGTSCGSKKWCASGLCVPKSVGTSCAAVKANNPTAKDGLYPIDPDGPGPQPPVEVFCDMGLGGWTLVGNYFDSAGDDMPNTSDLVVSGWQRTASGKWSKGAATVDRKGDAASNAAVSLAWVAALAGTGGQPNLKVCLVHKDGYDTTCRSTLAGSLTLVAYVNGNPKLTAYKGDKLTYTFGRLAGLVGSKDSYFNVTTGGYAVPRAPGKAGEFGFGTNGLVDKGEDPECLGDGGPWHGDGCGISYRPHRSQFDELSVAKCCLVGGGHPVPTSYGFRVYVGPTPTLGSLQKPAASCQAIAKAGASLGDGNYWIDLTGQGAKAALLPCHMSADGGGWTRLTAEVAKSLKAGVQRTYLWSHDERWYRSPSTTQVFSWTQGLELAGTWSSFDGAKISSFVCGGSAEKPAFGVGCSAGAGASVKVLPVTPKAANVGTATVCQGKPNAFGGNPCVPNSAAWVR